MTSRSDLMYLLNMDQVNVNVASRESLASKNQPRQGRISLFASFQNIPFIVIGLDDVIYAGH